MPAKIETSTLTPNVGRAVTPGGYMPQPAAAAAAAAAAPLAPPTSSTAGAPQLEAAVTRPEPVEAAEPAARRRKAAPTSEPTPTDAGAVELARTIRQRLGLTAAATNAEVIDLLDLLVDQRAEALDLVGTLQRDGFIPQHLTFPQRFQLGYALLDGCDTREVQTRLLDALAVSHGVFILNREER